MIIPEDLHKIFVDEIRHRIGSRIEQILEAAQLCLQYARSEHDRVLALQSSTDASSLHGTTERLRTEHSLVQLKQFMSQPICVLATIRAQQPPQQYFGLVFRCLSPSELRKCPYRA